MVPKKTKGLNGASTPNNKFFHKSINRPTSTCSGLGLQPGVFNNTLIEDEISIISVYDIVGREVSLLVNERMDAGVHEVRFDGG